MISSETTVAEIAARNPATLRILEDYGLDYCCGGAQTLEGACTTQGLSTDSVLSALNAVVAEPPGAADDWTRAPLSGLIRHILDTHHLYLRRELPRIAQRLEKVIAAHGHRDGPILIPLKSVFQNLADELETHLRKEEMILFPYIGAMERAKATSADAGPAPFGSLSNPIRVMRQEHDSAGDALREMRRITNGYAPPPEACTTYHALYTSLEELERDLHMHIHLENNILFPRSQEFE